MIGETLAAHNRFGFGLMPGEEPAERPRQWLLEQFERYEARPLMLQSRQEPVLIDLFKAMQPGGKEQRRTFHNIFRSLVAVRGEIARTSPTPFAERLVHFWSNHFAVSASKRAVLALAPDLEFNAIRPNLTGRFIDMLVAVETHPAMMAYLDQTRSIGPSSLLGLRRAERGARQFGLNENLGREILELHTMGVRSGYSQEDVIELSKALTGFTAVGIQGGMISQDRKLGSGVFDPARHEPGTRFFLGKRFSQSGENQVVAMFEELVGRPETALFLATKLARHFIGDSPAPDTVNRLAATFTDSRGDLQSLYRALVDENVAFHPGRAKFKSPWDWIISALRTSGTPAPSDGSLMRWTRFLGQETWAPKSPAGFPDSQVAWMTPSALIQRAQLAHEIASVPKPTADPAIVADRAHLGTLSSESRSSIAAAKDFRQGLSLYLMSPEFLWR